MRYLATPFATSGDRDEVPMTAQPSGSVSYPQGYGGDYSKDPDTDPEARRIERRLFNGVLFDLTTAAKLWQDRAFPTWFSAAEGRTEGYPLGAVVSSPTTGALFVSRVALNTDALTVVASWRPISLDLASDTTAGLLRLATQAESDAGSDTSSAMSPLRVAQRVSAAVAGLVTATQLTDALAAYDATLGTLAKRNSVNNANWSGAPLAVNNGGTGATTPSGARSGLGLANGATTAITVSAAAPSGGTNGDIWFQI